MPASKKCPTCGADLVVGAAGDHCLRCLFQLALTLDEPSAKTLDETPHIEQLGDKISHYKLLQQIGEGGCGVVYLAEQEEPVRRYVALKVIKLGMDTRNVIARFEAERQAMALMDHPNIAKVFDAGATASGRPFFVMELVRGIKITEFCDRKKISTRERLDLFVQVCNAIQHAHQKGVIHRDIKPSNILVTLNNDLPQPKVIDFGIAKATQEPLTDKTLFTAFEQFIGTPAYMSPEQAEMNATGIDTRSDIYSLGVLLYELLTGQTPFDSKAMAQAGVEGIRRMIREREPLRPSAKLTELTADELTTTAGHRQTEVTRLIHLVKGDLDWIVMKTLEKDRARRYETANGLAADIQHHLANEPVIARPPSGAYRLQKAIRRNKGAFAAGAVIVLVLLIGAIVSTMEAIRATRATRVQSQLRQEAEVAGEVAKHDEQLARASAIEAQRRFYAAQINLANRAWEAGELARTLDLLETLRPLPGQEDLRGFEWYYLWGLCNGSLLHTIQAHAGQVHSVAFSPDGATLSSCGEDGTIGIWDTATGNEKLRLHPEPPGVIMGVAYSPDGKSIIAGGRNGLVYIFDTNRGQLRTTLSGQHSRVWSVAVSPDGKVVASTGDYEITLWELASGRMRTNITGIKGVVKTGAFVDNSTFATGTGWGSDILGVDLWNIENGSHISGFTSPVGIFSLATGPNGKFLVTGGLAQVQLYDTITGQLIGPFKGHQGSVQSVAFSPDGKFVLSGSIDRTLRMWPIPPIPRTNGPVIGAHLDSIFSVAISWDGTMAASGANDGSIKLWNLARNRFPESQQQTVKFQMWDDKLPLVPSNSFPPSVAGTRLNSLLPSPDGKRLFAISTFGSKIWDLTSGNKIADWPEAVGKGTLSPDGKLLATGGYDGKVSLWETDNGQLLAAIQAHIPSLDSGLTVSVAFSPDGRVLATGSGKDSTIRLWDPAAALKSIGTIPTLPCYGISSLAYSHDGKMLSAALLEGKVLLLDATGRPKQRISAGYGYILSTVFSPDDKLLATSRDAGEISLWDTQTGRLRVVLKGHSTKVQEVAFSPDGSTLASASDDSTLRLWDVATGQERATFSGPSSGLCAVAFSPDGRTLFAGNRNGLVTVRREIQIPDEQNPIPPANVTDGQIDVDDYNLMAWELATSPDSSLRDGNKAVEFAGKTVAATQRKNPMVLDTLAAAYAEAGQFTNAVSTEQEAVTLLTDDKLKNDFNSRLVLYRSNSPYRSKP